MQEKGQSVTTTVLVASLNLDAFTLEAGWEHVKEVDDITLHTSVDRVLHGLPDIFFLQLRTAHLSFWHGSEFIINMHF